MKHIIYKDDFSDSDNSLDLYKDSQTTYGTIYKQKIILPQDQAINKKVKKEFKKRKTDKKITVDEMEKIIDKMIKIRNKIYDI